MSHKLLFVRQLLNEYPFIAIERSHKPSRCPFHSQARKGDGQGTGDTSGLEIFVQTKCLEIGRQSDRQLMI